MKTLKKSCRTADNGALSFSVVSCIALLVRFFILIPFARDLDEWSTSIYALDYSYGFILKGFIGTLMSIVYNNTLSEEKIYAFAVVNGIIMIVLFSVVLYLVLKKAKSDSIRHVIEAVAVGYMIHPYGLSAFAEQINFARPDSFYISAFLLAVISILSQKKICMPAAFFFCIIGLMIHPVYIVVLMPIAGILLLNVSLEDNQKQRIILFSSMCVLLLAEYVYFMYFAPTDFASDPAALQAEIFAKKGYRLPVLQEIYQEYMMKDSEWSEIYMPMMKDYVKAGLPCVIMFFMPVMAFFEYIWVKSFKRAESAYEKAVTVLCVLSVPVTCTAFYSLDWYRWLTEILLGQFMMLLVLSCAKSNCISDTLTDLSSKRKSTYIAVFLFAVFMLAFSSDIKYSFYTKYMEMCEKLLEILGAYY